MKVRGGLGLLVTGYLDEAGRKNLADNVYEYTHIWERRERKAEPVYNPLFLKQARDPQRVSNKSLATEKLATYQKHFGSKGFIGGVFRPLRPICTEWN